MGQFYFIKTKDSITADKLRKDGYQELPMESDKYVFVNNKTHLFSDNPNIFYSNKINV